MNARKIIQCNIAIALISTATAVAGGKQLADFDALREACKDPAKYQNQIAPSNIQITCTDVQYNWQPSGNGSIQLDTKRFVTSALASDKYDVSASTREVNSGKQVAACPRFKEVTETVNQAKSLTCADLLGFPGTAADYCVALVDDLRKNNPGSVQFADTGRTVDACSGVAPAPGNPSKPAPGRGQR